VLYVGATPVFADVDPRSWCLDPASFRSLITPRTRAVMPVHLYGHPCAMDEIMAIARAHGLFVVEDAAPSVGAEYQGRRVGSFGDFAAFSFQGAKLGVTGEGGMLVTSDEALYQKVHTLWDQGRVPGTFWIASRGWKYKMANMLAAFGLAQLERNDAMVEAKRRLFDWYAEGLRDVPHLSLNHETPGARSIRWMTSILLTEEAPVDRDGLMAQLKKHHIDSRPVFPAISQYPIWPGKQAPGKNAARIAARAINLPSGVCLARAEVDYICATIRRVLGAA
jgi:perosamine synthetase